MYRGRGRRLRPYSIAGIPYPEHTETQHIIVSGTTGSGKTVLISDLAAQISSDSDVSEVASPHILKGSRGPEFWTNLVDRSDGRGRTRAGRNRSKRMLMEYTAGAEDATGVCPEHTR